LRMPSKQRALRQLTTMVLAAAAAAMFYIWCFTAPRVNTPSNSDAGNPARSRAALRWQQIFQAALLATMVLLLRQMFRSGAKLCKVSSSFRKFAVGTLQALVLLSCCTTSYAAGMHHHSLTPAQPVHIHEPVHEQMVAFAATVQHTSATQWPPAPLRPTPL
jgi:hypothetical protein